MNRLKQAEKDLGNVRFVIGQATTSKQTSQLLERSGPDAPVLAISADIFGLSRLMPTVLALRTLNVRPLRRESVNFVQDSRNQ